MKHKIRPDATYNGYIAHTCRQTEWIDRYSSGYIIPAFKLVIETPIVAGTPDAEIDEEIKEKLGDVFPDIGLISHSECSRRALNDEKKYVPFGCRKVVDWAADSVTLELLLFDEFDGFPVAPAVESEDIYEDIEDDEEPEEVYEAEVVDDEIGEETLDFGA